MPTSKTFAPPCPATIHAWLQDMHIAADQDDAATVARLARYVTDKIAQEIEWQRRLGSQ